MKKVQCPYCSHPHDLEDEILSFKCPACERTIRALPVLTIIPKKTRKRNPA